jgi:hypothetical protein
MNDQPKMEMYVAGLRDSLRLAEDEIARLSASLESMAQERDVAQAEVERLRVVADRAENVVAQWRGDISRKPHIGQLREALAAWRVSTSVPPPVKP